jgi:spermidine/putrescine-binding protein
MDQRQWLHNYIDELLDSKRTGLVAELHVSQDHLVRIKVPYLMDMDEYSRRLQGQYIPYFYGNVQISYHKGKPQKIVIWDSVTKQKYDNDEIFNRAPKEVIDSPAT